jgi:hypothetical protein
METTDEVLENWEVLGDKTDSKYWKPEVGKPYKVIFSTAKLYRRKFKENEQPRLVVSCEVLSVDGIKPIKQAIFETGSWNIMREIKRNLGQLPSTIFLLKKKQEEGRISYIFEVLDRPGDQTPGSFSTRMRQLREDVHAFL